MGTRNLTMVFYNNAYVLAQYCQWDGYPDGQGIAALQFTRDKMDRAKFITALSGCTTAGEDEMEKLWASVGSKDGMATMDQSAEFKAQYPQLHRDMGADVLEHIQDKGPCIISLDANFAADSLFCEWAYVIDFDKNTFEVFKGFNQEPLDPSERFASLTPREKGKYPDAEQYYPIKLAKSWPLDALPTDEDFFKALAEPEEQPASPVIVAVNNAGDHRTGELPSSITPAQIEVVLGFKANIDDDGSKVKHSWGFTVDGKRAGIWDYKGSRWSVFDPDGVVPALFAHLTA